MTPCHGLITAACAACAALFSAHVALSQDAMPKQTAQTFSTKVRRELGVQYLLSLPSGYRAKGDTTWPLLVFLHGMGERGKDLRKVKVHGPPKLIDQGTNFPFVVVSPQCPLGQWWSVETLDALLDDVLVRYRVNSNRVYLTGISMGGFGSFDWALHSPERFAAVAPICGGGNPFTPHGYDSRRAAALKSLDFWVFHGGADPVVPVAESKRMVEGLKRFGCRTELTVYPGVEHDSWTQTYENPKLYAWFLTHARGKR